MFIPRVPVDQNRVPSLFNNQCKDLTEIKGIVHPKIKIIS